MRLPTEMQQIIFDGTGGPEVIKLVTGPVPRVGAGQVLIEVVAFALNRGDCMLRSGTLPSPPGPRQVPGLEAAGRIVAVADDVAGWRVGDEVCALVGTGGYAEYCVAPAALCFPKPAPLSLTAASALPEVNLVVWDTLFRRARLLPGESLLVHGGSGGIGSTAIQLAKHFGATVFTTGGSAVQCEFCRDLGADYISNYREEDFTATVKAHQPDGVDVILDFIGGDYIKRNLSVLASDGRHMSIMFMQGSVVAELDLMAMMMKRQSLLASAFRTQSMEAQAEVARELIDKVWPAYDTGELAPRIAATFGLNDVGEAHALMEASTHLGKIVVETGR